MISYKISKVSGSNSCRRLTDTLFELTSWPLIDNTLATQLRVDAREEQPKSVKTVSNPFMNSVFTVAGTLEMLTLPGIVTVKPGAMVGSLVGLGVGGPVGSAVVGGIVGTAVVGLFVGCLLGLEEGRLEEVLAVVGLDDGDFDDSFVGLSAAEGQTDASYTDVAKSVHPASFGPKNPINFQLGLIVSS